MIYDPEVLKELAPGCEFIAGDDFFEILQDGVVVKNDELKESICARYEEGQRKQKLALEKKESKRIIEERLKEIDELAIRPLRAAIAGTQTDADIEKLQELEKDAAELRGKLKG